MKMICEPMWETERFASQNWFCDNSCLNIVSIVCFCRWEVRWSNLEPVSIVLPISYSLGNWGIVKRNCPISKTTWEQRIRRGTILEIEQNDSLDKSFTVGYMIPNQRTASFPVRMPVRLLKNLYRKEDILQCRGEMLSQNRD